jgi:hypothetical protein
MTPNAGHTSVSLNDDLLERVTRIRPRLPIAKVDDLRSRDKLAPAVEYLVEAGIRALEGRPPRDVVPLALFEESSAQAYPDSVRIRVHPAPVTRRTREG